MTMASPRRRRLAAVARALAASAEPQQVFPTSAEALQMDVSQGSSHAEQVAQLQRLGFCIIGGVIPPEEVVAVRDVAAATAVEFDYIPRDPSTRDGTHPAMEGWAAKGPDVVLRGGLAPFVANNRLLAVMREVMLGGGGDDERQQALSVFTTTAQVNPPGMSAHIWHVDTSTREGPGGVFPGSQFMRPSCINALFFLSPFTAENGGTWIVPGSHRHSDDFASVGFPDAELGNGVIAPHHDTVHAVGPAGAVCLFDCRIWHCAAPNRSSESRVMINVRYTPKYGGLKPRDSIARSTYRELPVAAQQLYQSSLDGGD
eukprot:SAG31_NODE_180_length_21118_cov_62.152671_6_plen_315_part_00